MDKKASAKKTRKPKDLDTRNNPAGGALNKFK